MSSEDKETNKKKMISHIVGIGASAGGLKALQEFFGSLQSETGLAFVIIQHLSPDYKSMMKELLEKFTSMNVCRAEDGMIMEPDHIYLITPRKNITTINGKLFLADQDKRDRLHLPIDNFFHSLAEDREEQAIGIILSGTGSDGTRGLRSIKAEGGTIFVQDMESAEFDGMPRCAIATGIVDFILPPEQMPAQLLNFINHPRICKPDDPLEGIDREENSFTTLMGLLRKKTLADFSFYKPATIIRRIDRRMALVQVPGIEEYLDYIHRNPDEVMALFKDLLIGVTRFFRDTKAFQSIAKKVIPAIMDTVQKRNPPQLRIWNAGCSTGEEVYSIAIQVHEYMSRNNLNLEVKIFATDIDPDAIEFAGIGIYPESIAADVEVNYLSKYFDKIQQGYKVKKHIRQMVIFAIHNVISDPPFTKIDLIVCRNLLIYFQPILQKKVFHTFDYVLQQEGFLFLGSSETVNIMEGAFEFVDQKQRIYKHTQSGDIPVSLDLLSRRNRDIKFSAARVASENPPISSLVRKDTNQILFYQNLINKVVGTLLVVNEMRELVQSFGDTNKFLNLPSGAVSLDVLAMLPRELSLAVASSMQRVRKDQNRVIYKDIKTTDQDQNLRITLTVDMLQQSKNSTNPIYLIQFNEVDKSKERENQTVVEGATGYLSDERINDLEREVQFTRENLQATIEELQTTNEELQATNEELLAANEELQSTNEELQSVNEELNTVNAEYQNKVLELTELNADLDNLMTSSDIPTIFLDNNLCIRKFSAAMTKEINLLEQDIGRPLTDLNIPLFGNLKENAQQVIETGAPLSNTMQSGDDWFLQRILPFVDERHTIAGVVLTLTRITEQKNAELAWEIQHNLLRTVLDTSPSATIMTNLDGKIIFANKYAVKTLGYEHADLLSLKIHSSKFSFTDLDGKSIPRENAPLTRIIKTKQAVEKEILYLEREDGVRLILNVNANPIFNNKKELDGAVFRLDTVAHEGLI